MGMTMEQLDKIKFVNDITSEEARLVSMYDEKEIKCIKNYGMFKKGKYYKMRFSDLNGQYMPIGGKLSNPFYMRNIYVYNEGASYNFIDMNSFENYFKLELKEDRKWYHTFTKLFN